VKQASFSRKKPMGNQWDKEKPGTSPPATGTLELTHWM
jgi:hypothetical protein